MIIDSVRRLKDGDVMTVELSAPMGEGFYLTIDCRDYDSTTIKVRTLKLETLKNKKFEKFLDAVDAFEELLGIFLEDSKVVECYIWNEEDEDD